MSAEKIQILIDNGILEKELQKGAKNPSVIVLQTMLYELGYEDELNWKKFGADGDFGGSTTNALKAFSNNLGLDSNGEKMTADLASQLIRLWRSVGAVKELYKALKKKNLATVYPLQQEEAPGCKNLFQLLTLMDIPGDNLKAKLEKMINGSAMQSVLPEDLAARILDASSKGLGRWWNYGLLWEELTHQLEIEEKGTRIEIKKKDITAAFKKFAKGCFTIGAIPVARFFETSGRDISSLNITTSAMNLMKAVSENEGNFDGINTWDNSFLSFGIFQWTLGQDSSSGELAALLKKVKAYYPDVFEAFFGQFGLDVHPATDTTYGFLTLKGKELSNPSVKEELRHPAWAFRFWDAGQHADVQAVQLEHAISRLKNFYWKESYKVHGKLLSQVITSEYGVALLLDHHVNRPGYVRPCVEQAMSDTGLTNPDQWTGIDERKVLNKYLDIRAVYPTVKKAMTDARKRANNTKKYLDHGLISAERGSFLISNSGERGLDVGPEVPAPYDYEESAYPDIRPRGEL